MKPPLFRGAPELGRFLGRIAEPAASGAAVAYFVLLLQLYGRHNWLFDRAGRLVQSDFITFYYAGKLFWAGKAAATYAWNMANTIDVPGLGYAFKGCVGWPYPPLFFLVGAVLALFPFVPAFLSWLAATLALYGAAVFCIVKSRAGLILALASPAVLANVVAGQNGFLSAALFGAIFLTMERRPLVSGLLLALLVYKPQFGVVFPLVLIAGGQWRTFAAAACATLGWIIVWSLADPASILGFVRQLSVANHQLLGLGVSEWYKIQSAYGLVRWLGGNANAAWMAQLLFAVPAIAYCVALWRSNAPFPLKAGAACCAALLATPYMHLYDLPVLSIPLAFLYRAGPYDVAEKLLFTLMALVLAGACFGFPLATICFVLVAVMIVRRVAREHFAFSRNASAVSLGS